MCARRVSILIASVLQCAHSYNYPLLFWTKAESSIIYFIVLFICFSFFRLSFTGQVGITLDTEWYEPKAPGSADSEASTEALSFRLGIFADPLFKGDYPDLVKTTLQEKATRLGLLSSPLQIFSAQEIRDNTGCCRTMLVLPRGFF